jgi:hypothetical protein
LGITLPPHERHCFLSNSFVVFNSVKDHTRFAYLSF